MVDTYMSLTPTSDPYLVTDLPIHMFWYHFITSMILCIGLFVDSDMVNSESKCSINIMWHVRDGNRVQILVPQ